MKKNSQTEHAKPPEGERIETPMPASGGGQAKEPNKTDKEILCQRQPIDTKTAAMVLPMRRPI